MPKLKLNPKQIHDYRKEIVEWNLPRSDWFDGLSDDEVAIAYNGVGSSMNAKWLRKALTKVFWFAIHAVIIHDTIWQYKERFNLDWEDFSKSNEDLKIGSRICLSHKVSKWNPMYWWYYRNCWCAQQACEKWGKEAWNKKD